MNKEDKLSGLFYQFVTLYERWSEDRQTQMKNGIKVKELIDKLSEQTTRFGQLESQVRNELASSIEESTKNATNLIAKEMTKEASFAMNYSLKQLEQGLNEAEKLFSKYKFESKGRTWKIGLIILLTSVLTSFILFKFVMPKPVFPLNPIQIVMCYKGMVMAHGENKLTKKEWQTWKELFLKAEQLEIEQSENQH